MSLDRLRAHYGFTRQPFGRDLAPAQLFQGRAHQEAVARIRWLVDERGIGVVTGEVGAGKTVSARAAVSQLDGSRFTVVYLPNPAIGGRGLHMHLVYALGGTPRFHTAALINQTQDLLAAEGDEKNKTVLLVVDLCRPRNYADEPASGGAKRCRRRAAGLVRAWGCRHSHRLSRSARSGSAGL